MKRPFIDIWKYASDIYRVIRLMSDGHVDIRGAVFVDSDGLVYYFE